MEGCIEQSFEVAVIAFPKPFNEVFQTAGFDVEITGRPDQLGQLIVLQVAQSPPVQGFGLFKIIDGPFDVSPGGVLGENGPDDYLSRRFLPATSAADRRPQTWHRKRPLIVQRFS